MGGGKWANRYGYLRALRTVMRMNDRNYTMLLENLDQAISLVGDYASAIVDRVIPISDASLFEIDELLMRATLVVDVMFRQEGMTVGFSKPDVHLAEALVRGAWSAYTLFSAAEFLRSRRYYGVIIAVHVVLEARKHGLAGIRKMLPVLEWQRTSARDVGVMRALDDARDRAHSVRGKRQAAQAVLDTLGPFKASSLLANAIVTALEVDVDSNPDTVVMLLGNPMEAFQ